MTRAVAALLGIGLLCGTALVVAEEQGFPNTKRLGRAIVQYRDKQGLQVVLSYEYSQRHHDSTWLLIDYVDFVVHVFEEEERDFYRLENLWRDAPVIEWEEPAEASGG